MIDMYRFECDQKTLFTILLSGVLTQQEYEVFRSHFESEIRHYKALRLMFEMGDEMRWDPRSQWRNLKFDSKHHTDIYKLAIVGDDKFWRDWVQSAFKPVSVEHIFKFSLEQKPLARSWLEL